MNLSSIKSPTLLLDKKKCKANIRKMVRKTKDHRVELNPHFKTHQSIEIGQWFRDEGITKITVSSVRMAQYFVQDDWNDITIAFPVNTRQLTAINELAGQIALTLFVNSESTAHHLEQKLEHNVDVYTEIDTGYHRTGIPHDGLDEIQHLLDLFNHSKHLNFKGFYVHAGQTYHCSQTKEIAEEHGITLHRLNQLRKQLADKYSDIQLSIGDTPSCSTVDNFAGIHSIHPGNFVFYDINQYRIGSCHTDQIAVALACPVVSRRPERNELILHGGAIHFSKDYETDHNGKPYFGRPVSLSESGWSAPWKDSYLRSLSQEHGILKCNKEKFNQYKVGDLVGILPIHSCLTCDLMGQYTALEGTEITHMQQAAFQQTA